MNMKTKKVGTALVAVVGASCLLAWSAFGHGSVTAAKGTDPNGHYNCASACVYSEACGGLCVSDGTKGPVATGGTTNKPGDSCGVCAGGGDCGTVITVGAGATE